MKKLIPLLFTICLLYSNTHFVYAIDTDVDYTPIILSTLISGTIVNIAGIALSLYSNHYFYNTVAPLANEFNSTSDIERRTNNFAKFKDASNMHAIYVTAASVLIGVGTASTIAGIIIGALDMSPDPERNPSIKSKDKDTANTLSSFSSVPFGDVQNTSIILNSSFIGVQIK